MAIDVDNARILINWCRHHADLAASNLTSRSEVTPTPKDLANHLGQLLNKAGLPLLVQNINPKRWTHHNAVSWLHEWADRVEELLPVKPANSDAPKHSWPLYPLNDDGQRFRPTDDDLNALATAFPGSSSTAPPWDTIRRKLLAAGLTDSTVAKLDASQILRDCIGFNVNAILESAALGIVAQDVPQFGADEARKSHDERRVVNGVVQIKHPAGGWIEVPEDEWATAPKKSSKVHQPSRDKIQQFVNLATEIITRIEETHSPEWWGDVCELSVELERVRREIGYPEWTYNEPEWPAFFVTDIWPDRKLDGLAAEFSEDLLNVVDGIESYGMLLSRDPMVESYRSDLLWSKDVGSHQRIYHRSTKDPALLTLRRWIRAIQSLDTPVNKNTQIESRDNDSAELKQLAAQVQRFHTELWNFHLDLYALLFPWIRPAIFEVAGLAPDADVGFGAPLENQKALIRAGEMYKQGARSGDPRIRDILIRANREWRELTGLPSGLGTVEEWYAAAEAAGVARADQENLEVCKKAIRQWAIARKAKYHIPPTATLPISIPTSDELASRNRLFIDDLDDLSRVRDVSPGKIAHMLGKDGYLDRSEDDIQSALETILDVPFHKQDWPGEINDLYTANVRVRGRRIPTAFMLKGNGLRKKEMRVADCGENGDQLIRLFSSPADLFIVQFVGNISEMIIQDVKGKVAERRHATGYSTWFLIMDGQDTARILHAYSEIGNGTAG